MSYWEGEAETIKKYLREIIDEEYGPLMIKIKRQLEEALAKEKECRKILDEELSQLKKCDNCRQTNGFGNKSNSSEDSIVTNDVQMPPARDTTVPDKEQPANNLPKTTTPLEEPSISNGTTDLPSKNPFLLGNHNNLAPIPSTSKTHTFGQPSLMGFGVNDNKPTINIPKPRQEVDPEIITIDDSDSN